MAKNTLNQFSGSVSSVLLDATDTALIIASLKYYASRPEMFRDIKMAHQASLIAKELQKAIGIDE